MKKEMDLIVCKRECARGRKRRTACVKDMALTEKRARRVTVCYYLKISDKLRELYIFKINLMS